MNRKLIQRIGVYAIYEGKLSVEDPRSFYAERKLEGRDEPAPIASFWNLADAVRDCTWWTELTRFQKEYDLSDHDWSVLKAAFSGDRSRVELVLSGKVFLVEVDDDGRIWQVASVP